MRRGNVAVVVVVMLAGLVGWQAQAGADFATLGTAQNYAVLGGAGVTNTGFSVLNGDLGVSPGSALTGFPPGIVNGTTHQTDAAAAQAQSDLTTAYNNLWSLAPTVDLTGQDLGGLTLTPGVYFFSSSAQLTGNLTLNALSDPDALFVFQIGSTLTTASNSSVTVINAPSETFCEKYFVVGSSATLGTDTDFEGSILALTSITLNHDADIVRGRALARNGAVTLDDNTISTGPCAPLAPVPEPGTLVLLSSALPLMWACRRRWRSA
jgi:hypothetical protein